MRKVIYSLALLSMISSGPAFAAEPAHKVNGEFANNCAMAMTEGKKIGTDCHINWTDPQSKKTFCFGDQNAQHKWSTDVAGNETKAQEHWKKMQHEEHAKVTTKPKTL